MLEMLDALLRSGFQLHIRTVDGRVEIEAITTGGAQLTSSGRDLTAALRDLRDVAAFASQREDAS